MAGRDKSTGGEKGAAKTPKGVARPDGGQPLRNPGGKLGQILVDEGVITEPQLQEALQLRDEQGGFLGQALCELEFIDQGTLTSFLVKQCKIPHLNLLEYELSDKAREYFPEALCAKHRVLPIDKIGKMLTLAMVNPLDIEALAEIRKAYPALRIKPILCDWGDFEAVFAKMFRKLDDWDEQTEEDSTSFGLRELPETAEEEGPETEPDVAAPKPEPISIEEKLELLTDAVAQMAKGSGPEGERGADVAPSEDAGIALDAQEMGGGREGAAESSSDARIQAALKSGAPLRGFSFDTFLSGEKNEFTCTMLKAVGEDPGGNYNPLYIWGGVGLGKTHLLNALGNRIVKNHPEKRVGYISSTRFACQVVEAHASGTIGSVYEAYSRWDVLLVDDIQFLAGRDEPQEAFYPIFDAMVESGRQIVVSGDMPPEHIKSLNRNILSRLSGGIVAHLTPPSYETRMAILRGQLGVTGARVPEEVLALVAMRLPDDVRKLTGTLRKIVAFAELKGEDISCEAAGELLKELGIVEVA